jgi:MFS family permease
MHRGREESYRGWASQLTATVSARLSLRYERRVMVLLLLVLVVDYADRTLIGALGPTLQRVFHIGNTELGFLAAAFSAVGAVATIPLGMLVDRLKRTWLLALSLVVWAAAMGATRAAVSFAMLFAARLLLGAVSATTGPTIPSLTGDFVRAGRRAKALGFIDSGQLIGTGIGFLLAALVTSFLSFRWCFWLLGMGGAGLAVASWRPRASVERPGRGRLDEHQGDVIQEQLRLPRDDRLLVLAQRVHDRLVQMQVSLHQRRRGQRQPLAQRHVGEVVAPEQLQEAQALRAGILDVVAHGEGDVAHVARLVVEGPRPAP